MLFYRHVLTVSNSTHTCALLQIMPCVFQVFLRKGRKDLCQRLKVSFAPHSDETTPVIICGGNLPDVVEGTVVERIGLN